MPGKVATLTERLSTQHSQSCLDGLQLAAAVPFLNLLALLPVATITATSTYLHMRKGGDDRSETAPTPP